MEAKRLSSDHADKSAKPNSHRRKAASQFRSARSLALRCKSTPRENKTHCSFCKEGGALLPCDKCNRSFHLLCLGMRERDVPAIAWFCTFCSTHKEKKLHDEAVRKDKEQRAKKDALIKDTLTKLSSSQKDHAVKRFAKKYPQYIRQGRIMYPIEDTLLALDPALHQVLPPAPIPRPQPSPISPSVLGDLLYICDFCCTFRQVLSLTPFTPDQLYQALTAKTHSVLLKEVLMSLLDLAFRHLLSRETINDAFSVESHFSRTIFTMKEYVKMKEFLPYTYLLLLTDVLKSPCWRDLVEDGTLDTLTTQKIPDYPLEDCFYTDYNFSEKVDLLTFLINCLYDTKEIHEELTRRLETKTQNQKEKHEIQAEIKTLEAKKNEMKPNSKGMQNVAEQIGNLQEKLSELMDDSEDLNVRTSPIGLDRDYTEYFSFKFDPRYLYVKLYLPLDVKRMKEPCESGYWYIYRSRQSVNQLQNAICPKGVRESKLFEGLKTFLSRDIGEMGSLEGEYGNVCSRYVMAEDLFYAVQSYMLEVENRFSEYLRQSNKCWELEQDLQVWRTEVESAQDVEQLRPLLQAFVAKSRTPFKLRLFGEDDSADPDQEEECLYERKYRKVSLRIWQDLGDTAQRWNDLLGVAQSRSELGCVLGLLHGVLMYYMKRKPEVVKVVKEPPPPPPKPEGVRTRRALRIESKKHHISSSSSSDSHDSVCLLCQDAGELIMCEGCPRVVHPQCIGLTVRGMQQPPEEDWYCDGCQKARDTCRLTRSRTRLRKLGCV